MADMKELFEAREDMEKQNELYRPTSFWADASSKMVADFSENGIENFRSLEMPLNFFVPTYGAPGNGFSPELLEAIFKSHQPENTKQSLALSRFFSGYETALADYRVLLGSDEQSHKPYLHTFSESKVGNPIEHFEFENRFFSRSALNYLLGLCFLKRHIGPETPKTVLEVGGGFGTLGEILAQSGVPGIKYIDIDIPPTSFAAQYYLTEVLGKENVTTYNKTKELDEINISTLPSMSVLCSWQIEKLRGQVDLFVNFISFQEMEPVVVENYFKHVRRLNTKWILLRNMREGKQKKTSKSNVGVENPILAKDYARMLPGYSLIDSNVFPYGYRTVDNFHSELYLFKRRS